MGLTLWPTIYSVASASVVCGSVVVASDVCGVSAGLRARVVVRRVAGADLAVVAFLRRGVVSVALSSLGAAAGASATGRRRATRGCRSSATNARRWLVRLQILKAQPWPP